MMDERYKQDQSQKILRRTIYQQVRKMRSVSPYDKAFYYVPPVE